MQSQGMHRGLSAKRRLVCVLAAAAALALLNLAAPNLAPAQETECEEWSFVVFYHRPGTQMLEGAYYTKSGLAKEQQDPSFVVAGTYPSEAAAVEATCASLSDIFFCPGEAACGPQGAQATLPNGDKVLIWTFWRLKGYGPPIQGDCVQPQPDRDGDGVYDIEDMSDSTPPGTRVTVEGKACTAAAQPPAVAPPAAYNPSITLDPEAGAAGSEVQLSGQGFPPNVPVSIYWDGQEEGVLVAEGQTDSAGSLSTSFSVPPDALQGDHEVAVSYDDSGQRRSVSARFEVREFCIQGDVRLVLMDSVPLQDVEVSLWWSDPVSTIFAPVAIQDTLTGGFVVPTGPDGSYIICSPRIGVPSRDWLLQVRLGEIRTNSFDVVDQATASFVWGWFGADGLIGADPANPGTWFSIADELDLVKNLRFEDLEDKAETQTVREDHALDAALIYYHSHQAMRVFQGLGVPLAQRLMPIYVYDPGETRTSPAGIVFSAADSEWNNTGAPKNREWHEFAHYVMWLTYGGQLPTLHSESGDLAGDINGNGLPDRDTNHAGYLANALSSSDAIIEGFAEFMPLAIADQMNGLGENYMQDLVAPFVYTVSDGSYAPQLYNLELNHPQNLLSSLPQEKRTAFYDQLEAQRALPFSDRRSPRLPFDEEHCVASLLWDLYDPQSPGDQDAIQLPLETLWSVWSQSYTLPQYYPGQVITGFLGDDETYAGQWVYYDSANEWGSFTGERRLTEPFPFVQRYIWYIRDLYDALMLNLPDSTPQIDQVFASHKVTLDTYRFYTDYTTVAATDLTTFAAPGAQIQAVVGPEAAHEFWSQGVVADVVAAGWGAGFTIDREPAFDARGFLYLWIWINAPQGTTFDLVVEDYNGQWLCPGTSEAVYQVGEAPLDSGPYQQGTGTWGAYSPPGMVGGPWPYVAVLNPSAAAQWQQAYQFQPNPNHKTPPAGASGPDIRSIQGIGVLFTSPGSYRALVGAMVVTLDYPWKAGMRTLYGIGDPAQGMWLPYRRSHPPLEGAKALLQVDRVPATVWVSYDYAPPYRDLSFQYPVRVTASSQEIGLYIEPAFDGQEHALRLSAQVEGYAPGEPVTLTSTDYWTQWSGAGGAIPISLAAGTEEGSGYTMAGDATSGSGEGTLAGETGAGLGEGTTAGDTGSGLGEDTGAIARTVSLGTAWLLVAGACGATFLGIAALVVVLASSRRRRREAARRPAGDDWSTGGSTADYYGGPDTEYDGGSDVGVGPAGWPESAGGIEGWDDPGAGGSGGWPDTSTGIEGWDEPGGGGSDSWGHA